MKIIAKSFPNMEQIQGRIDSKAFDGVEIFTLDDIINDFKKYEELVKFARDNFGIVNFETFYAVNVNGEKHRYGLIDERPEIRERSRRLFEETIKLNDGWGNVNTHLVGNHVIANPEEVNVFTIEPKEQLTKTGEYLKQFANDITLENVFPFDVTGDLNGKDDIFLYNIGCDMESFKFMYEKFGIPMTLDTAHLAISLSQYSSYARYEHIPLNDRKFKVKYPDNQRNLGSRILVTDLMNVFIGEVNKIPKIKNAHFINARINEKGVYSDGYIEFVQENGMLLDLFRTLHLLHKRPELTQILPEVVDGNYASNPDYVKVPNMVEMALRVRYCTTKLLNTSL